MPTDRTPRQRLAAGEIDTPAPDGEDGTAFTDYTHNGRRLTEDEFIFRAAGNLETK